MRRLKQVDLPPDTMRSALEMQDEVQKMIVAVALSKNPRGEMAALLARVAHLVRR
jgi:hypothetical protein